MPSQSRRGAGGTSESCAVQPEGKLEEDADLPIAREDRFRQATNQLDQMRSVRSSTFGRFAASSSLPLARESTWRVVETHPKQRAVHRRRKVLASRRSRHLFQFKASESSPSCYVSTDGTSVPDETRVPGILRAALQAFGWQRKMDRNGQSNPLLLPWIKSIDPIHSIPTHETDADYRNEEQCA